MVLTVGVLLVVWERALRRSLENGGSPSRARSRRSRRREGPAAARGALEGTAALGVGSRTAADHPTGSRRGGAPPDGLLAYDAHVNAPQPNGSRSDGARSTHSAGPHSARRQLDGSQQSIGPRFAISRWTRTAANVHDNAHPSFKPLTPGWARRLLPDTVTGAVAGRVLQLWWRDPRQRVSLLIVPFILLALTIGPMALGFRGDALVLVVPGVGTLIGLMMLNHTAYDGTALWSHLAVSLPGRVDRAGRALGTGAWAIPVVVVAAVAVCVVVARPDLLPATIGSSASTVLIGLAFGSVSSVVIAFPAPPAGANPFITPSGGNVVVVLQQFAGGLIVGLLSLPVYVALALATWWNLGLGWALLVAGPVYGLLLLRLGNHLGGRYLDQYGPELLRRITPART